MAYSDAASVPAHTDRKAIVRSLIETGGALDGAVHDNALLGALPDARLRVVDQIAEGDLVATRIVVTGTHRCAFHGISPTGAPVRTTAMAMHRVLAGRVVEVWMTLDVVALLPDPSVRF
jgi:predicted ester cyclase